MHKLLSQNYWELLKLAEACSVQEAATSELKAVKARWMKCIVDSSSWSATAEETIWNFFYWGHYFYVSYIFGDGTAILRDHPSDGKV